MKTITQSFIRLLALSAVFSLFTLTSAFAQVVTVGTVCQTYQTSSGQIQNTCPNQIQVNPNSGYSPSGYTSVPAPAPIIQTPSQKYPALCAVLNRTFGLGDSGPDVKQLQIVLGQEGIAYVGATGYFGKVTKSAVKIWQTRNGFVSPTGAVGTITLGRMKAAWCYGDGGYGGSVSGGVPTPTYTGTGNYIAPSSINGPADVTIVPTTSSGNTVNLQWTGTNVSSCTLNGQTVQPLGQQTVNVQTQTDFTIICTGYNGNVTKTITVRPNVDSGSLPSVSAYINPTSALVNSSATIFWTSTNASSCTLNGQTVPTSGSQQIYVTNTSTSYRITCTNQNGLSTSSTIYANGTSGNGFPLANIYATNPSIVVPNGTTLNWNSSNTLSCTVSGGAFNATGLNGSQMVYPTVTTTYTISCTGSGGQNISNSITVNVTPISTSGSTVTADSYTDTQAYRSQQGATITFVCPANFAITQIWGSGTYSDDSSVCTSALHAGLITQAAGGQVSVLIGGAQNSFAATTQNGVTSTYYGYWPGSFTFTTTSGGTNTANFTANPMTTTSGQATTLTWNSPGAGYCNLSATGWNLYSQPAVNGSTQVTPTVTTTYSISCYASNSGGAPVSSGTVTVTVNGGSGGAITVTPVANPNNVTSGQASTITANIYSPSYTVNSCTITGGAYSGTNFPITATGGSNYSYTGSLAVYPTVTTSYTINCTNSAGQTGQNSVYVTVGSGGGGQITITPNANPTSVTSGQASTITANIYSANYTVNSCTITGGAYSGTNFPITNTGGSNYTYTGTMTVYPTTSTTYTINCTNSANQTGSNTAYVTVNGGGSGAITITPTASPNNVTSGQASTITATIYSPNYTVNSCTINGGVYSGTNFPISSSGGSNYSYTGTINVNPTVTTTYTINCTNSANQTGTGTVYITVGGSTSGITAYISANITTTTYASQPVTLTWSSTNATYCNISGGSTNLMNQPTNWSTQVFPAVSTSYIATCYNAAGQSQQSSPTYVTVGTTNGGNVSVTITSNYQSVSSGQAFNLTWTSTNANYCNITANNNQFLSNQSPNNSQGYSTTISVSTNFVITCFNSSGQYPTQGTNFVYVTVNNNNGGGSPTVTVTPSLYNVSAGQQVQLNWYTSNGTSNYCNVLANGNVIASNQTSNTYIVVPTQTTTYQVNCYNTTNGQPPGTGYATVTVNGGGGGGTITLQSNQNRYVTVLVNNSSCYANNSYVAWGDGQTSYLSSQCGQQTVSHQYYTSGQMNVYLYVNGSTAGTLQVYVQ